MDLTKQEIKILAKLYLLSLETEKVSRFKKTRKKYNFNDLVELIVSDIISESSVRKLLSLLEKIDIFIVCGTEKGSRVFLIDTEKVYEILKEQPLFILIQSVIVDRHPIMLEGN